MNAHSVNKTFLHQQFRQVKGFSSLFQGIDSPIFVLFQMILSLVFLNMEETGGMENGTSFPVDVS
jgi:hypothetical protein